MQKLVAIIAYISLYFVMCSTNGWGATVSGNNSNWTVIGSLKSGSLIRIDASGIVDFGCAFGGCKDTAVAGVTRVTQDFMVKLNQMATFIAAFSIDPIRYIDPVRYGLRLYDVFTQNFGVTQ